jgi:hypothetical protein
MSEFDGLYARWWSTPLPSGSKRDAVDELHADLALVDVWVADTIIPLVEDGVWKPRT